MDFDQLIALFEKLEKTSSGNSLREILAEFWKEVPAEDIAKISYLILGQIASQYENVVLGMAEKMVEKAIASASGMEAAKVRQVLQQEGDIGLAAEKILHQKPRTLIPVGKLTVQELFDKLHKIAAMSGSGSQDQKINLVVAMLQKCSPAGARYLSRMVLGTLRLGVGDMTVLDSLALAYTGDKKNKVELEAAYNICPDIGVIAETVARKGLKGLAKIEVHVGRPIKMMLAQRVKLLEDLPKKMPGKIAVEGKYDGERVQAHKDKKGKITLFSRRLDDITQQFPDLVKYLEKQIKAKEYVMEGEIVAIGPNGKLLPFQTLMQRRRKHDIEEYIKKIPIQIKIFDALYLDGESLLKQPYEKRCAQLEKVLSKSKQVVIADKIVTDDIEKISQFFKQKLKEGEEGIIAKSLSGEYQAGTRGWNWIKWKKDYAQDMVDTFDLVVVGAYYGRGRRSGNYGALLCAAYNDQEDSFETVCKLGTGMTDEILEELPRLLKKYKVEKKPARVKVKKEMEPEVWFEPKVVVEVLAAEITTSPFHTLGLALRFPRFIKLREDKKAEQATTSKEFREMK